MQLNITLQLTEKELSTIEEALFISSMQLYDVQYKTNDPEDVEEYRIVGSKEADPSNNKISNESPLAKAIMNAKVGEIRSVESPNGTYDVEIVEIL